MRTTVTRAALFSVIAFGILAADKAPTIKHVAIASTPATSGEQMFANYCAACHGLDGKGSGPAAPALSRQPANLTQLAVNNGGTFPELKIVETLVAGTVVAHGSAEMPVWGELFKRLDSGKTTLTQMRITNLTAYIKSLQAR
jgi:mono/diheme cytochrome c family protein